MHLDNIEVSRRSFLGGVGVAGATAAVSMIAGCAPDSTDGSDADASLSQTGVDEDADTPMFLRKPEAITEFADTKEFDVVVVGAGNAGVVAALRAFEEGAKVALVQKQNDCSAFGFRASGIDLESTTPAAKEAMVSLMMKNNAWRSDRDLLRAYADTSGEAILWLRDRHAAAGITPRATTYDNFDIEHSGYTAHFICAIPSDNYMEATPALCEYAISQGVEFFGGMPAVQLITEEGAVTGVVAGKEGAYTLFGASRGVILATGDYCCNPEMLSFYCPDINGYPPLTEGRDGDGHCMGTWAGGRIEPIGHTKMIHDYWQNSAPFLLVDDKGNRFADEHMPWWELNTIMRPIMQAHAEEPDAALMYNIIDSEWASQVASFMRADPSMQIHDGEPPEEVCFAGETIEEVAAAIGVDPSTLRGTVDRYNELVEKGADDDFGKDARFLAPIKTPPFMAVQRDFNWGLSAVLGGLVVDSEQRVLDDNDEPIRGLYAAGNVSGPFFGDVDYSMQIEGLSIGRAGTTGYIAGGAAARA